MNAGTRVDSMTGLVGVVTIDPSRPPPDEQLDGLVAAYRKLRPAQGVSSASADGLGGVVAARHSDQGASGLQEDAAGWSAFTGVTYGEPLASGPLESCEGFFALVRFDRRRRAITIATDPLGLQSLFICLRAPLLYFSTSALALAKALRRAPDARGVFTFLRIGHHIGDSTLWEGVQRLEPGCSITVDGSGMHRSRYWRPPVDGHLRRQPFASVVSQALAVLEGTAKRQFADRPCTWIDLSGGFDSRLLSLSLDTAGARFIACTRGDPDDDESRIAAAVAHSRGWEWHLFSYPDAWGSELAPLFGPALAWGDGQLGVFHLAQRFWKHARTAPRCASLAGGGAGEILRGFAWQQEFLRAGRTTRVNWDNWLDMRVIQPLPTGVFASDPTPWVREDLRSRFRRWTEPYADEPNTFQLDATYVYRAATRYGAEGSAERAFHIRHWPYLNPSMVALALNTSFKHKRGHRLMRHMIQRLDPRVAAMETSPWGGPAEPFGIRNAHRFRPYVADIAERGANKLSYRARGKPWRRRPAGADDRRRKAYVELYRWLAGDAKTLRYDDLRSARLFERTALQETVHRAADGRAHPDLFDRIATVEAALRAADAAIEREQLS
jgi:hypothetical protein